MNAYWAAVEGGFNTSFLLGSLQAQSCTLPVHSDDSDETQDAGEDDEPDVVVTVEPDTTEPEVTDIVEPEVTADTVEPEVTTDNIEIVEPVSTVSDEPSVAEVGIPEGAIADLTARISQLEDMLAEQLEAGQKNRTAINRIEDVVYTGSIPAVIQNALDDLSSKLSLLDADQFSFRGAANGVNEELAAIREAVDSVVVGSISEFQTDLDNLGSELEQLSMVGDTTGQMLIDLKTDFDARTPDIDAQMEALQGDLDRTSQQLAAGNQAIDSLIAQQVLYREILSGYLGNQITTLMDIHGAQACTEISLSFDVQDFKRITLIGSVWNEDLHQSVLDIPLLSAFDVDDQLSAGAGGLGCSQGLGDYNIALNPETGAPGLFGKVTAIEVLAMIPNSSDCQQIVDTIMANNPEILDVNSPGVWVRSDAGLVEACKVESNGNWDVDYAPRRFDKFYLLLAGDVI